MYLACASIINKYSLPGENESRLENSDRGNLAAIVLELEIFVLF